MPRTLAPTATLRRCSQSTKVMRVGALGCLQLVSVSARADDEYGARAVVDRKAIAATHGEDPSASGTALELRDRITLPRSLAEVVREAPGVRVQSTGALGAFSSVSLRGSDGNEAVVMLDEIPLVTPDGGAFDLSLFPAELFERVDVFRGGAPVWLGSGAIGGVLRLVPRRDPHDSVNVAGGGGSFGLYQLQGGAAVHAPRAVSVTSQVVVRGAQNNYPYVDDRGTLAIRSDDLERTRNDAQIADASGFTDLTVPVGKGRVHLLALAQTRAAGYPGPGSRPSPNVKRTSARTFLAASYERRRGGSARSPRRSLQLVSSAAYNLDRYTDIFGEVGPSTRSESDDKSYRGFLRAAGNVRLTRYLDGTLVASYALDRYAWENRYTFPAPSPSTRHTGAAALELSLHGMLGRARLELRPSARVEWSHTSLSATNSLSEQIDSSRSITVPTARIGAALEPVEGLSFSASIATGARLPTMFELFGDRALVLPAPTLKPVHSTTYDAGVTLRGARGAYTGQLEARAFWQERRDAIIAFRTSQFQVSHQNLSAVQQRGLELGGSAGFSPFLMLHASLTYLDTESQLGRRLPFRPSLVSYLRPELRFPFQAGRALSGVSLASEFYHRSFVFADLPNILPVPACSTVSLSGALDFWSHRMRVSARVDDVADVRCRDLVGFPLPGRAMFLLVEYREAAHEKA